MAESLLVVEENDRDRFLDYCLKRRIMCDNSQFLGSTPNFKWKSGISQPSKVGPLAVIPGLWCIISDPSFSRWLFDDVPKDSLANRLSCQC